MTLRGFVAVLCLGLALSGTPRAQGNEEPGHDSLPNLDKRQEKGLHPKKAAPKRDQALQKLKSRVPGFRIDEHPKFHRPSVIYSLDSFLTGPQGRGGAVSPASIDLFPPSDPYRAVKALLHEHPDVFGLDPTALQPALLRRDFVTPHNGLHTMVWQQQWHGIDVYEGVLIAHVTEDGSLVSVASDFVPELDPQAQPQGNAAQPLDPIPNPDPVQAARQAVVWAAHAIEEPTVRMEDVASADGQLVGDEQRQRFSVRPLPDVAVARKVWLPREDAAPLLCWEVELTRRMGGERYRVLADARTGEIMLRLCRTLYLSDVTYRVYTGDSPAPMSPGPSTPSTNQAAFVERQLVTLSALSTNASPTGWIHDGENELRGNNVEAHLDRDADNTPDVPRPQGTAFRVFDYPLDTSQSPLTYGEASAVQLFYWCNWMHDRLYELGFTEAAGNFQKDNFGRGGQGLDPVIADSQDGLGFNNANFTPTPDGLSPRIQMYLFDGPQPNRDGSLDAAIVLHEYTHGLTERLVGGGVGIGALQTLGMGEGWSDFYALTLLSKPGDDPNAVYAEGGYATYQLSGLTQNYYYGIRRYPYSTDRSKNPLTFKDIDPNQISSYPAVPRSPIHPFDPKKATVVHRQGEVWCVTLWEVRANLIAKHGFDQGNRLTLQLVTDGLKLTPGNPNFLQARDGILQADRIDTGGDNLFELWSAFAKRGMGASATSPASGTTAGVKEAYDLPDLLTLQPLTTPGFISAVGHAPAPACRSFTLTNRGSNPASWKASLSQFWLNLSQTSGVLAPGASTEIQICPNASAVTLAPGTYFDSLRVTNLTTSVGQGRGIQTRVVSPVSMPFTENFESGNLNPLWVVSGTGPSLMDVTTNGVPLNGQFHLTMESAGNGLPARNELTFAADLQGYTNVLLQFRAKSFHDEPQAPPAVAFVDGTNFDGVAVSPDGYTWYPVEGLTPPGPGFSAYTVSLDDVAQRFGLAYSSAFFIRFNQYGFHPLPNDGLAWDDISLTGFAPRRFEVQLPELAREGDGLLSTPGTVQLGQAADSDLTVQLVSSAPGEISVPGSILIPAGALAAPIPLTILDDTQLDGRQSVRITATAPGYVSGSASMNILDNETATLTLGIPTVLREGQGVLFETGTVLVNPVPTADIPILLRSSDPSELAVPLSINLSAGASSVRFNMEVVDDRNIDGDQTLVLYAFAEQWEFDAVEVTVQDNEHTGLIVNGPFLLNETSTTLANAGTVSLSGLLPTNLTVTLSSSDESKITVPTSLTLTAGVASIAFPITVKDDALYGGGAVVFIHAVAPPFSPGAFALQMLDNEAVPAAFAPNPPHLSVQQPLAVDLSWQLGFPEVLVNGDFETGTLVGWIMQPGLNGSFIVNDGTFDPLGPEGPQPPYAGRYSALAQQIGPGQQLLFQDVTLPRFVKRITWTWADRVRNHGPAFSSNQAFRVEVRNLANGTLAQAFATAPGQPLLNDWAERSFDLTPFQGQRVRLAFIESDDNGFLNVQVDRVRLYLDYGDLTISEVYFGSEPVPGDAQFVGLTTNSVWTAPPLELNTDYYWQIVARRGTVRAPGPIWTFRTRGFGALDHFSWDPIAPVQAWNTPFPVRLSARDDLGNVLSNFAGGVRLRGIIPTSLDPLKVLTFTGMAETTQRYRHTLGAISTYFPNYVETTTVETDPTILRSLLDGKDVFLVVEQRFATASQLISLGEAWGPILEQFASNGGTVIVCSYLRNEHEILNRSGLLPIAKVRFDEFQVVAPVPDTPLTEGLDAPFTAFNVALYESPTNAQIQPLLTFSSNRVVAATRVIGDGRVALIGTDYATNRTGMDRLVANLVQSAQAQFEQSVRMSPAQSGYFINGRWSGNVVVHDTAHNLTLEAAADDGHKGRSDPFDVVASSDLYVQVTDHPDPVLVGELLNLDITVGFVGPGFAAGVVLTNQLPPGLAFASVAASSGDCRYEDGVVSCDLGTLQAGGMVSIALQVRPIQAGSVETTTMVASSLEEAYFVNNTATVQTRVNLPTLTIDAVQVNEGDAGSVQAVFQVRLFPPNALTVFCDFVTTNTTASPGLDYEPVSGTLIFSPGVTNQTIVVPVFGDVLNEMTEAFAVNLFNPVSASLLQSQNFCAIFDNDPAPSLSLSDAQVLEGDIDIGTNVVFHVTLSAPSGRTVRVSAVTAPGTATPNKDFIPTSDDLHFAPGVVSLPVIVRVIGDDQAEPEETFLVQLQNADGAPVAVDRGVGTIVDDDAARLDHFTWSTFSSTQFLREPFMVTLRAEDASNQLFAGFQGEVDLTGLAERKEFESGEGDEFWEYPLGASFHDQRVQSIYLASELGGPSRITALALQLGQVPGQRLTQWTLRLKHTPLSQYLNPAWESEGWQTVYQRNESLLVDGWVVFPLVEPFEFNGQDNLLVDFSFNNATYSANGSCLSSATKTARSIYFQTDSGFGNPLLWSPAALPIPEVTNRVPVIRFQAEAAIPIDPVDPVIFTNGVWTGPVAVRETSLLMNLRARQPNGREGLSDAFSVTALDDLGVSVTVTPDPIAYFGPVTYSLLVTNTGPSASSGVILSNQPPAQFSVDLFLPSQGQCAVVDGVIVCQLGTLAAQSSATVVFTGLSTATGLVTNRVEVTRAEPELHLVNNVEITVTPTQPPSVFIADATMTEGSHTTNRVALAVTLSNPSELLVSIPFRTVGGSATNTHDYVPQSGLLLFEPGTTNLEVFVEVLGDLRNEREEFFNVELFSPTNAVLGKAISTITILDDDPFPVLSVAPIRQVEGNQGNISISIQVSLSEFSGQTIRVNYATGDGTARAGQDYQARSGQLLFPAGSTNRTIASFIQGDTVIEGDETFIVTLSSPVNALLPNPVSTMTIVDDEGLHGVLDHFVWNPITPVQSVDNTFPVTIVAHDYFGQPVLDYEGLVPIQGREGAPDIVVGQGTTPLPYPVHTGYHDARTQLLYLAAELESPGPILGLALNVILTPGQTMQRFTIRLKHTALTSFAVPAWETTGWTTVFQRDLNLSKTGWADLRFDQPFLFNGTGNLLVDFSFNNGYFTSEGSVLSASTNVSRALVLQSDSKFGDPLDWTGTSNPAAIVSTFRPNLKFIRGRDLPIVPAFPLEFLGGAWSGLVSVRQAATNMVLRIDDGSEHSGSSNPFTVFADPDLDQDGLSDTWEWTYFGSLNAPNGDPLDDPDQDGTTNATEFHAGTDPLNAASVFLITYITVQGSDVRLRFASVQGKHYRVERAAHLDAQASAWSPITGTLNGTGQDVELLDPGAALQSRFFYRILLVP